MPHLALTLPVPAGHEHLLRRTCEQASTMLRAAADESRARAGVVRERIFLQEAPPRCEEAARSRLVLVLEAHYVEQALDDYCRSREPFDAWMRENLAAATGIDLARPAIVPTTSGPLLDWRDTSWEDGEFTDWAFATTIEAERLAGYLAWLRGLAGHDRDLLAATRREMGITRQRVFLQQDHDGSHHVVTFAEGNGVERATVALATGTSPALRRIRGDLARLLGTDPRRARAPLVTKLLDLRVRDRAAVR